MPQVPAEGNQPALLGSAPLCFPFFLALIGGKVNGGEEMYGTGFPRTPHDSESQTCKAIVTLCGILLDGTIQAFPCIIEISQPALDPGEEIVRLRKSGILGKNGIEFVPRPP